MLLMFAGAASAEVRTFQFTGTVTFTSDTAFAAVGTTIHGKFSYDTSTAPVISMDDYASYRPESFVSATVAGHTIVTDRLGVDVWNNFGHANDIIDIFGFPVLVDSDLSVDGSFGFRLMTAPKVTTAINDTSLPVSYNVADFSPTQSYGWLQRDGSQSGTILQFSVDSIIDDCRKVNGKSATQNCWSH
jgi:hypothetical protein